MPSGSRHDPARHLLQRPGLLSAFPALLRGPLNTLLLGLLRIGIGIPVGLLISLVRLYAPKPFRWLATGYIDIFRAMPVLVVLILIYYALPFVGIRLSSWVSATLAFSFVMSAYSAEVFRSGIESIPHGQFEAASALGLPFLLRFARSSCRRPSASSFRRRRATRLDLQGHRRSPRPWPCPNS